jgi:outer membrane protein
MRRHILCAIALVALPAFPASLTFQQAIQLAAQHSPLVASASDDETKAWAGYMEARNQYLPQVILGAGLGYSNGFPLSLEGSAPSVFNITSQQTLFNPAQAAFVRSARAQWHAASASSRDQRGQAMLDAAVSFAELAKIESQLQAVGQQSASTAKLEEIERQRVQAGIDNPTLLTKARLNSARTRMRVAELEGAAIQLRQHLADLTGVSADGLEIIVGSIPPLPEPPVDPELAKQATQNDPRIAAADLQLRSTELRAEGERKMRWPQVDLASQYAVLARFNNYDVFFNAFQRNNVTVGLAIRVPFLNFTQKAHADQAAADVTKASRQYESLKLQVTAEVLKLQSLVKQLAAAHDVAQLEYELARADTSSTEARMQSGEATLGDVATARVAEEQKFDAVLDAAFEQQKAQLQLLKATGKLEDWALAKK